MSSHKPVITSWHGYKTGASSAELVMLGYGFGSVRGSVKLNVQGGGTVNAVVLHWSPQAITVVAPVDKTVQRAHVYILDERGKEKQSAQSPAGQSRDTLGTAPTITVTATEDNENHILVTGTNLNRVKDIVLYDSALPSKPIEASFLLNDGKLEIDWPASFVSPIKKMRLSDGEGNKVLEVDGGQNGWTPDPNGIIISAFPQLIGNSAVINMLGSGFGAVQGTVKLGKVGEPLLPVSILSNGWSDSAVQAAAVQGASYDRIELTRSDGEVATVSGGVVYPIEVPSGVPTVTSVTGGNLTIDIVGSGLVAATTVSLYRDGVETEYVTSTLVGDLTGSVVSDALIRIVDPSSDDMVAVDRVEVVSPAGAVNVVAPDLGGPWAMDDPATIPPLTVDVAYDDQGDRAVITASQPIFARLFGGSFAPEGDADILRLVAGGDQYVITQASSGQSPTDLNYYHRLNDYEAVMYQPSIWNAEWQVVEPQEYLSGSNTHAALATWTGSVDTTPTP